MKDFWAEELQNQRKGKIGKTIIALMIILIIIAIYYVVDVTKAYV